MSKGVLLAGYYGAGNTGDEAILAGLLQSLRDEGIERITVLSRNPAATRELHKVESCYAGRQFEGLGKIFGKMRETSLFILGGGGLLQDHHRRVVPFWLSRVFLALLAGTPVFYCAQGIGPLQTKESSFLVRLFSNRVDRITVRDEKSLALLKEIGVTRPPVEVTADPALGIRVVSDGYSLLRQGGVNLSREKIKVGIALRSWEGEEAWLPPLVQALRRLKAEHPVQYIIFPFQGGQDEDICRRLQQTLAAEDTFLLGAATDPEKTAAMLKEMDAVIAMRLHAAILSTISLVPSFGLIYDPKVFNFLERIGIAEHSIALQDLKDGEELAKKLSVWLAARKELSRQMEPKVTVLKELTRRNAVIAGELLLAKTGLHKK